MVSSNKVADLRHSFSMLSRYIDLAPNAATYDKLLALIELSSENTYVSTLTPKTIDAGVPDVSLVLTPETIKDFIYNNANKPYAYAYMLITQDSVGNTQQNILQDYAEYHIVCLAKLQDKLYLLDSRSDFRDICKHSAYQDFGIAKAFNTPIENGTTNCGIYSVAFAMIVTLSAGQRDTDQYRHALNMISKSANIGEAQLEKLLSNRSYDAIFSILMAHDNHQSSFIANLRANLFLHLITGDNAETLKNSCRELANEIYVKYVKPYEFLVLLSLSGLFSLFFAMAAGHVYMQLLSTFVTFISMFLQSFNFIAFEEIYIYNNQFDQVIGSIDQLSRAHPDILNAKPPSNINQSQNQLLQ